MGTINIFLTDLRTFKSNFGMTGGFAVFEHFFTRPTKGPRMFRSFIKKDTFLREGGMVKIGNSSVKMAGAAKLIKFLR